MAQSQNKSVELTMKATSYNGLPTYGNVMLGDKAFEFYNERNPEDYIQIPWDEVDHVAASVVLGKKIPRFAIFTKENGHFTFSALDNKATLRCVRDHVGEDRMLRSPSFFQVIGRGLKSLLHLGR